MYPTNASPHRQWLWNIVLVALAVVVVGGVISMRAQNATLAALLAGRTSAAAGPRSPEVGDVVPSSELRGLDGETSADLGELADGPIVVAILTTTCPYCERSLPVWAELAQRFGERKIGFVGVCLSGSFAAKSYVQSHSIDWPVWIPVDSAELKREFNIRVVPLTLLLSSGEVVAVHRGEFTQATLQTWLRDVDEFVE